MQSHPIACRDATLIHRILTHTLEGVAAATAPQCGFGVYHCPETRWLDSHSPHGLVGDKIPELDTCTISNEPQTTQT